MVYSKNTARTRDLTTYNEPIIFFLIFVVNTATDKIHKLVRIEKNIKHDMELEKISMIDIKQLF